MSEQELAAWKIAKKTEAYEELVKGRLDHDEYRVRLGQIDMILV